MSGQALAWLRRGAVRLLALSLTACSSFFCAANQICALRFALAHFS